MPDSADNIKNNSTSEIKVSSNYEEFVQGVLNQKNSDYTFDKKLKISPKLKTSSNNQNLKEDKTELEEKTSAQYEPEKIEFDNPRDNKHIKLEVDAPKRFYEILEEVTNK